MHDEAQRAEFRRRLEAVRDRILREVPGCGIASDQLYREYDLAIDFCEDVPPLPREAILKIQRIFQEAGAHAKISSIHVNGWFGDFDKLSMVKLCCNELFGIDLETHARILLFAAIHPMTSRCLPIFPSLLGWPMFASSLI